MELLTRLNEDLKDAMRQHDIVRRTVLRSIKSDIHNEEIEQRQLLSEQSVITVIAKQVKQRRESIEEFKKGKRQDLVTKEESELDVLMAYLPAQLEKEELIAMAKSVIDDMSAKGIMDKGIVMGKLMPEVRGKADGSLVNSVVTELLTSL
jgi:uncharacterized protein YqeY|tara:strand:- start:517 stop:966 length:450 start_codon:yes stop_codon:yes gene_type:complete